MIISSQQPGAGRNVMNTRFTSNFVEIGCPELEKDEMIGIFNTLLQGFLDAKQFEPSVKTAACSGIHALVDLYTNVR